MDRRPGLSVRVKLTLSYVGLLMVAGGLLLTVVLVFLLRYVPVNAVVVPPDPSTYGGSVFIPGRSDLWRAFAPRAATAAAFLLVFSLVGGWLLAGRMLAPLTRVTEAARLAAAGSLSHRVRLPGRTDEVHELADAFDTMLARIEAHDAEQRRFTSNASHELRTPLAITRTLLDVARKDPDRDTDRLLDRLQVVNSRAIDLTEALLLLGRANQRAFTRDRVDLSILAEEAAETLLPLAEKQGVTVTTTGEVAPTVGSQALLLQLTTNLLHNAIVHNLPEHGTVQVSTAVRPGWVVLTVESSGARLAPERVATFTEPFQRGTERVHDDQAGVGLGLAIVTSIAQAHDGAVTLTPRPEGGLRVRVRLPAAPPQAAA